MAYPKEASYPRHYLLFIDDLLAELSKGIKAALYADDLVMWCVEEYATTATYRMQQAADELASWADHWCVSINKEKSSTTLFALSNKQKAGTIKVGETRLKMNEKLTYLGVTYDKRQTWKSHIQGPYVRSGDNDLIPRISPILG